MDENNKIQLFEDKRIRTAWDEENETWYDTVIRETFEETGLTLDINKIKFLSITENYKVYKDISHTQIKHYALFKYNQSVDVDIKSLKCSSFFERITKNNKKNNASRIRSF